MKNNTIKLLGIIGIFAISACSRSQENTVNNATSESLKNEIELSAEAFKNATIIVSDLKVGTGSTMHKATGKVEVPPQNLAILHIPLGGYLKSTVLLPGLTFKKGQILAVAEDVQFIQIQQEYLQTKSELAFAEQELNRQKTAFKNQSTNEKSLQEAALTVDSKEILLNALSEKLLLIGINPVHLTAKNIKKTINILAPFDGFVSSVNAKVGKYFTPSDDLAELINGADMHLVITVYEKNIQDFSIGKKIVAYSNENPSIKYEATVLQINKHISENRSTEIHCHFTRKYPEIYSGMFLNIDFEGHLSSSYQTTSEAVVRVDNVHYIFVPMGGSKFKATPVNIISETDKIVNFTFKGNESSKKIVTAGANTLMMEMRKE